MHFAMLNRRRLLALMGASATLPLIGGGFVSRAVAADGTVTIAYNVNLPSFDPTVGASAVNPTIQALYQAIFDPYVAQEPDLKFKPGLLTDWGWNEDKTKVHMTVRDGATWHNGDPVTAEDVVWSLRARRQGGDRQPDPVHLVDRRQLPDRRQQDHRRRAPLRADLLHVDGLPHRLRAAEEVLRERRRRGLRGQAGRLRPLHGRRVPAERLPAAQGQPRTTGAASRPSTPSSTSSSPTPPAASPSSSPARPT